MNKSNYVLFGGKNLSEIRAHDRNRSPEFIPPRDHVAEVLETTADRFESGELLWYAGDFEVTDDKGQKRHCAIGGLCMTSGEDWHRSSKPVVAAAAEAMRPHISRQVSDLLSKEGSRASDVVRFAAENLVITFNDRLARDVSEVVEVMKLAAKDLRNQS